MRIETLREFVIWAESKSVEAAAKKVHISQSALSKHLMSLENEMGVRLINRTGKNHLTEAGLCMYNGCVEILARLHEVEETCKRLDKKEDAVITVWDPFVFSGAMSILERLMYNFETNSSVPFRYELKNEAFETPRQAIEDGLVDVAIDYVPIDHGYEDCPEGVQAFRLLEEPLIMWCNKSSALATKETVSPLDLKGVPIMASMRLEHPLYSSITHMCEERGFKPIYHRFDPVTPAKFFFGEPENCVYVITQGMQGDNRLQARDDMVIRKFDDKDFAVSSYVLVREDPDNEALAEFADYLSDNTSS